ncbi:MAG: Magnesium transporter MgtE [Candidatus Dependentiae bacterium]|nr:Magnesium transporter MgtE [Candidatus Dependentiae bacterium]
MLPEQLTSLVALESIIEQVLDQSSARGVQGWAQICRAHPSDIADLIEHIARQHQLALFINLPLELGSRTFNRLSRMLQADILLRLNNDQAAHVLKNMHADILVDLFEELEDEQVEHFLKLLQKKQRSRIISLLSFDPKSAGGIMNSDVLTLQSDLTVKNCINILQRLSPQQEVRYRVYVTDKDNILVGHITLDKLVLNKPETPITTLMSENELVINAYEDQEEAVKKMTHYGVLSSPVVDGYNHFLGIITGDDVVTVMEEEASEDVYRMSGVGHIERSYFETSTSMMFFERSKWLIGLLLLQSVSSVIMRQYEKTLEENVILTLFLTMLIGTGGNAGNQSATLVIRGLSTGEIGRKRRLSLIMRESLLSLFIASLLSIVSFCRVWIMHGDLAAAFAIGVSLFSIVCVSMLLGTLIPLTLHHFKIDPAHSAAPFLATLMDVIGILIYCSVCSYLLG